MGKNWEEDEITVEILYELGNGPIEFYTNLIVNVKE